MTAQSQNTSTEQKKQNLIILLDNGHGKETPGKCSPDKTLLEWAWNREMAKMVCDALLEKGFDARLIVKEEKDISLGERCRRINAICSKEGTSKCISVSVHINAAGGDGKWHEASGWSVFVSPNASNKSKILAKTMYDVALANGLKGNRSIPREHYWVKNLAMCRDTNCPAVLLENLFMDNKQDCQTLKSEEGKKLICDTIVEGLMKYAKSI